MRTAATRWTRTKRRFHAHQRSGRWVHAVSLASSSWRRCRGSGRAEAGLTSADAGSRDDQAPAEDHQQRRWIRPDRPQSSANGRRRREPEGLDSVSQRRVLRLDRAEHRVHAVRGHSGDASDLLRPGPSVTKPAPDGGRRHAQLGSDRSMARAGRRPGQRGDDRSGRRPVGEADTRPGAGRACARSHHSAPAAAGASAAGHPPLGPVDGRPAPGPQAVGAVAADGPAAVQAGFGPGRRRGPAATSTPTPPASPGEPPSGKGRLSLAHTRAAAPNGKRCPQQPREETRRSGANDTFHEDDPSSPTVSPAPALVLIQRVAQQRAEAAERQRRTRLLKAGEFAA